MRRFRLVDKLEESHCLTEAEWVELIEGRTPQVSAYLRNRACAVRDAVYGRKVFMRGLIELSNHCRNDCFYCGIRCSNRSVERYRLDEDEVIGCCEAGYGSGFRTFVLQGGEDPYFTDERLVPLVGAIHRRFPDCAITLSLGERSGESYRALFDAGAGRYLLRHETADPAHYSLLHPRKMNLAARKDCLFALKEIGYQVGSGFMVGSPGQKAVHLARDMGFLRRLQPHMVGIGPFIPHRQTRFAGAQQGSLELTLFMLACIRLAHPRALIPATTALGTIDPDGRELGVLSGANVVMPNLSPEERRRSYDLYDGKACFGAEAVEGVEDLRVRIGGIGYELVADRGDSLVPRAAGSGSRLAG